MMNRVVMAMVAMTLVSGGAARAQSAESTYQVVENWAKFPEGVTAWSAATGVDIDPRSGNIYVFHRNEAMPIMAFDKNGKFLRAWGQGMFKTTHFLRTDREGNVWVTDSQGNKAGTKGHQVIKFSPEGKVLMKLGKARMAFPLSITAYPLTASQLRELGVAYTNCYPGDLGRLLQSYREQLKQVQAELG